MRQIDAGNVQQKLNLVRDKINDLESIDYAEILKKRKEKKKAPFFKPVDSKRHQQLVDSKEYSKVGRTREISF
jgi:hypothetical protein